MQVEVRRVSNLERARDLLQAALALPVTAERSIFDHVGAALVLVCGELAAQTEKRARGREMLASLAPVADLLTGLEMQLGELIAQAGGRR